MIWRDLEGPAAFNAYMESVDGRLRDQGVDIPARPIQACSLISLECQVMFGLKSEIADRINSWFEKRYGDRLFINMDIGQMLVHINEDPFLVTYPLIYGTWRVEPLKWIEKVTDGLLITLPADVVEDLATAIMRGYSAFKEIQARLPAPLTADLEAAPGYIFQRPAAPGLSKWASQQAVEKTLSAYIKRKGGNPRSKARGAPAHDLLHLDSLAQEVGLPACEPRLLETVNCGPNIRYPDREQTSILQAILANQASVLLCQHVAEHWEWPHGEKAACG